MDLKVKNCILSIVSLLLIVYFVICVFASIQEIDQYNSLIKTGHYNAITVTLYNYLKAASVVGLVFAILVAILSVSSIGIVASSKGSRIGIYFIISAIMAFSSIVSGFIVTGATKTYMIKSGATNYSTPTASIMIIIFMFIILILAIVGVSIRNKVTSNLFLAIVYALMLGVTIYSFCAVTSPTPIMKAGLALECIIYPALIGVGIYTSVAEQK